MNARNVVFVLSLMALQFVAGAYAAAPLWRTEQAPIRDSQGRTQYIVSLRQDAADTFPDQISDELAQRFFPRNTPRAKNMVASFERRYSFEATDMTNWVANTFTAYLTQAQVNALREDPQVTLVTELALSTFSAPWYDNPNPPNPATETIGWGRSAVNGKTSTGGARVYVIDAGVGYHEDLGNVVTRVNASCNSSPYYYHGACTSLSAVGCYQHATHVAGIISATAGNGKGIAGVDAGARIYSVSVGAYNNSDSGPPARRCAAPYFTASNVASAMDWAMYDMIVNDPYHVHVVNISINDTTFAPGGVLNSMMLSLSTPVCCGVIYAGAFVVQSAGNQGTDACSYAFGYSGGYASTSDGIMVVGMHDYQGTWVGYFTNTYAGAGTGNYGPCVEVWAPGKSIYSTFGPLASYDQYTPSTWQDESTPYQNYVAWTGTSMAAPHIAGVAAYLIEHNSYGSPAAVEAAVRNLFYNLGTYDPDSLLMYLTVLP